MLATSEKVRNFRKNKINLGLNLWQGVNLVAMETVCMVTWWAR